MRICFHPQKTSDEITKRLVTRKNEKMAKAFAAVPASERVIFVPHCMRNVKACKAKEMGSHYICVECKGCKIADISRQAKELGYKALYVLKGGKAVDALLKETKPKAIVGVACYFEGKMGMELSEKHRVAVQFVPLTRDGCVDTDVNLEDVFVVLARKTEK